MYRYYIYTLSEIDPITNEKIVRDVGQTKDPIRRKKEHLNPNNYSKSYLVNWERNLLKKGLEPIFDIIKDDIYADTIEEIKKLADYWEQYYIAYYKELSNKPLVNGNPGGFGVGPMSEHAKQNMSNAHKGLKHSEETKKKIGLSNARPKAPLTKEHREAQSRGQLKRIRKITYPNKPIYQYDLEGNFIKEWESARQMQRLFGYCHSNIMRNCDYNKNELHLDKSAYKFRWRYKEDVKEN